MSKTSTPHKGRRAASIKRSNHDLWDAEMDHTAFNPHRSPTKRFRPDRDIDLSGLVSDTEEDIIKLFEDKFQDKSPTSKLSGSFKHIGLKESNLLKKPKVSSLGRRTIGLTSEERDRKRRMNRSLNFFVTPKSPDRRSDGSQSSSPRK